MRNPLVSILIPAYKPAFFERALLSAIDQNYENLEIVVGDDCPDDQIKMIVEKHPDPRIRYIKNSPAKGPMYNYVFLFHEAKGKFIKYLNDDDELHPNCVGKMVSWFDASGVTLVTCRREEVSSVGQVLEQRLDTRPLVDRDVVMDGRDLAAAMLFQELNFVGEPSCFMFRKKDALDIKPHLMTFHGLGKENSGLGDVALALSLLEKGDCAYLGTEALVRIRRFEGQWQEVSPARAWSLRSWKTFRREAVVSGFIRPWHGFGIRYRNHALKGRVSFIDLRSLLRRGRIALG